MRFAQRDRNAVVVSGKRAIERAPERAGQIDVRTRRKEVIAGKESRMLVAAFAARVDVSTKIIDCGRFDLNRGRRLPRRAKLKHIIRARFAARSDIRIPGVGVELRISAIGRREVLAACRRERAIATRRTRSPVFSRLRRQRRDRIACCHSDPLPAAR
jgi:hypothetical protein